MLVRSDILCQWSVNNTKKEINSLGLEKLVYYIRFFLLSDLFISSFHCNINIYKRKSQLAKTFI